MSDTRNNFSEDAAARRYRSAVETVDERPSAATRAAILAAAARQVGAQPQSADAPPLRPARRRWPLAAAAAVLLSTLAVMLAVRTEREMPSFTAPAPETSNRAAQQIAPPAPPPAAAPPASGAMSDLKAQVEAEQESKPTVPPARDVREERSFDSARRSAVDPAASARSTTERSTTERSTAEGSTTDRAAVDAVDARSKLTKEAGSPEPTPPAPKTAEAVASIARAPAPKLEAAAPAPALGSVAGVGPRENDVTKRKDERNRQLAADAPRSSALPSSAPMTPAADRAEGKVELSAADWMKRIVELRAQGRDEEADQELRKFKERYPEVVVPAEALSRAATR